MAYRCDKQLHPRKKVASGFRRVSMLSNTKNTVTMGTKRPHEELDDENAQIGSHSGGRSGPSVKKHRPNSKSKHRAKEGSIEYAKKRARTIERLFQKNHNLPANVKNELERELESHKATVEDKTFQKKRSAMISKYHMVRFFGRDISTEPIHLWPN